MNRTGLLDRAGVSRLSADRFNASATTGSVFLFCDGFIRDIQSSDDAIVGCAFISEDDVRSFPDCRFRLWLSASVRGSSGGG